jgi:alkylated DNA repair dioxygenase AlkB
MSEKKTFFDKIWGLAGASDPDFAKMDNLPPLEKPPRFEDLAPVILDDGLRQEHEERKEELIHLRREITNVGEFHTYALNGDCVVQVGPVATQISEREAKSYFGERRRRVLYGKEFFVPRFEAVMADENFLCSYSHNIKRHPWGGAMMALRKEMNVKMKMRFNMAIMNLYLNGRDYVAAHCDDEPEIDQTTSIVTVSYGASRLFRIRNKKTKEIVLDLKTMDRSFITMHGHRFQSLFTHEIVKQSENVVRHPRMSITFRRVMV